MSRTQAPIYIPSKGRADNCLTANLLVREEVDFNLVVEPRDFEQYAAKYGRERCVSIDRNDGGISYARNWCKQTSIKRGEPWHWQIDDDVKSFRIRENGKNVHSTAMHCLGSAEAYTFQFVNVATAGLTHTMFAWTNKKPLAVNRQCCSVMLVNNVVPVSWRDNLIEDTDYALQVLYRGATTIKRGQPHEPKWCTLVFCYLLYDPMPTMSMKGGNTEISHANGGRERRSIATAKMWPGALSLKHEYGSVRLAASRIWSKFPQRPTLRAK